MISQQIEVIAQLVPSGNGTFPVADTDDIRGSLHVVNTVSALYEIDLLHLKEGMLGYVKDPSLADDKHYYTYLRGVWRVLELNAGEVVGEKVIESIRTYYLYTDELAPKPTVNNPDWSTEILTNQKTYLWAYTETKYLDGSIFRTDVSLIGKTSNRTNPDTPGTNPGTNPGGDPSATVVTVSKITEEYALGNDEIKYPTSWQNTLDGLKLDINNKYLWCKRTVYYTNGETDVSYSIIGRFANDYIQGDYISKETNVEGTAEQGYRGVDWLEYTNVSYGKEILTVRDALDILLKKGISVSFSADRTLIEYTGVEQEITWKWSCNKPTSSIKFDGKVISGSQTKTKEKDSITKKLEVIAKDGDTKTSSSSVLFVSPILQGLDFNGDNVSVEDLYKQTHVLRNPSLLQSSKIDLESITTIKDMYIWLAIPELFSNYEIYDAKINMAGGTINKGKLTLNIGEKQVNYNIYRLSNTFAEGNTISLYLKRIA